MMAFDDHYNRETLKALSINMQINKDKYGNNK